MSNVTHAIYMIPRWASAIIRQHVEDSFRGAFQWDDTSSCSLIAIDHAVHGKHEGLQGILDRLEIPYDRSHGGGADFESSLSQVRFNEQGSRSEISTFEVTKGKHGSLNKKTKGTEIEIQNPDTNRLLIAMAREGVNNTNKLIEMGADFNYIDPETGKDGVQTARANGHTHLAYCLERQISKKVEKNPGKNNNESPSI